MFARLFGTADLPDRSDGDRDRLDRRQRRLGGVPLDPSPFILLNLAFSLQVAYAAPLILLVQTRQADRDKALAIADAEHRDALARESLERQEGAAAQAEQLRVLLESNTKLTAQSAKLGEQVERLTREIHARVCVPEQA